jgi:hypothetical protein
VELVLTLGQTPDWATSNPSAQGPYGAGCSAPPKDLEDWKTYVGTLAQRYKGRVKYWEIWNEANDPKFYSGSLPQLQALAQSARAVLKQISPMNSVLSPSIQGGALKEFKELANAGVLKACDIASYHFYAPMGTPELAYQRMLKVREILDGADLSSMPVWNTEVGWLNNVARGGKAAQAAPAWARGWRSLSETDLAAFIVRTALLSRSAGIPVVIWYAWDNSVVGLGGAGGGRGSQAVIDAFNLAADTVMKASRVSVNKVGDVWQADIEGRDGTLKAFWVEDGEVAFQMPAGLTTMPGPAPVDHGVAADRASSQRITGTPLFFRPKG